MRGEIVTPGEIVADNKIRMHNAFSQNGKTYSSVLGIKDERTNEIVSLEGVWDPRPEDSVVGIVSEDRGKVYIIDLSYFGRAILVPGKYEKYELNPGDIINAIIKDIEGKKTVVLKDARVLKGGTILSIKPKKIPRIIGKKSTMIRQIAEATGSHIVVGMNGLIWLSGGNMQLATETLLKIEREAHLSGLTETIKNFLDEKK
ncbi:MAG: KH domain-containing protein [Candidatus Micrarchaeaceae archaeon]